MGSRNSGTWNCRITKFGIVVELLGPGRALTKVGLWLLGEPFLLTSGVGANWALRWTRRCCAY